MSNFYMEQFQDDDGITYTCAEAYFQAGKAWLVKDSSRFMQIAHARSGLEAKKLSNAIKELPVSRWNEISRHIMADTLFFKFSHNADIRKELISTGNKVLIEARDDRIWASGMKTAKATAKTPISEWRDWIKPRWMKINTSNATAEGENNIQESDSSSQIQTPLSPDEFGHVTPPSTSSLTDEVRCATPITSAQGVNELDEVGGAGDVEMTGPIQLEKDDGQDTSSTSNDLGSSDCM
ncbi:07846239-a28f-4e42-ad38-e8c1c44c8c55 [Sclerotinia trifoliorum]|uniref:07846239-a28f-4e42-ad38-e8c1c44c8c55 n=1 Tax=Sclerotinia trifoliorum TaxID=28548 RepID=A0A8H2W2H9_9HELO|nr:07846239-a28f-4e42-ad38-e8c1c44c8c55 [Sclerotinia trifoliorum]